MDTSADTLVDRLARGIARWGLATPALAFLEANKPLSFIGSQALLVFQPVLDIFVTRDVTADLVGLLADRKQLEMLITRVEALQSRRVDSQLWK